MTQVENSCRHSYDCTISYLQWVYFMLFFIEVASVASEAMFKYFSISKYKNCTENHKTWKPLSTEVQSGLLLFTYFLSVTDLLDVIPTWNFQ